MQISPSNILKLCLTFPRQRGQKSADGEAWMNIRCSSATASGKSVHRPPRGCWERDRQDQRERGTQQNRGSRGLGGH